MNKTVFITGATGAVGSALVPFFRHEPETDVIVLVRADNDFHLQERLNDLFAFWNKSNAGDDLRPQVRAVRGDVCLPQLGMSEADYSDVAKSTTHIIHAAGNVKLNHTLEEARQSAVSSLQHVLELIKAIGKDKFQKLDYVSTVGVGGKRSGSLPETPISDQKTFHNTYEAAKAEAENILWPLIDQGLPATIHRPSMVVGDSQSGRIIHFQVFYYLCEFMSGRRTWGVLPFTGDAALDIIPADYVGKAIWTSQNDVSSIGRVFHLCSGPKSIPLRELTKVVRAFFRKEGSSLPVVKRIPNSVLQSMIPIAGKLVSEKTKKALDTLPHFLTYLEEKQTFANTETDEYLSQRNLKVPEISEYLETVLEFYREEKRRLHEEKNNVEVVNN